MVVDGSEEARAWCPEWHVAPVCDPVAPTSRGMCTGRGTDDEVVDPVAGDDAAGVEEGEGGAVVLEALVSGGAPDGDEVVGG